MKICDTVRFLLFVIRGKIKPALSYVSLKKYYFFVVFISETICEQKFSCFKPEIEITINTLINFKLNFVAIKVGVCSFLLFDNKQIVGVIYLFENTWEKNWLDFNLSDFYILVIRCLTYVLNILIIFFLRHTKLFISYSHSLYYVNYLFSALENKC